MSIRHILTNLSRNIPDEIYLKLKYRRRMHKKLNLKNPKTFNEKLQWLKLNYRDEDMPTLVDKCAVKQWVAERIGEEFVIPTIGVWNYFDDICFDDLPNQFVLKCTHDSGGIIICRDKEKLDITVAKGKIEKSLSRNYYWHGREWPYKNVKPRIIAENYLENTGSNELKDFKLFCFDGKVGFTLVCSERFSESGLKEDFYDLSWNKMNLRVPGYPNSSMEIERPQNYDCMIQFAEKLSKGIPLLRVDYYEVQGRLYFGELTFIPASGFLGFDPPQMDLIYGQKIKLPQL